MKMKIINILLLAGLLVAFTSCGDYLEMTPDEDLTLEDIFSNRFNTAAFQSNIYSMLPDEAELNLFTGACDEMEVAYGPHPSHIVSNGAWNPNNAWNYWVGHFEAIRKCNLFLENVDQVPVSAEMISTWKGEVFFLRAFNYFMLMRLYGSVPIISHSLTPSDEFVTITRDPIVDVVDFIIQDCDRAIALLEPTVSMTEQGRATSTAAYALKSRTLLYLASDLFNGNSDYANLKNSRGENMYPDYDAQRWADAAAASLECINEAHASGYGLYKSKSDYVENYINLFVENNNPEWIFSKNVGIWGTASHFDNCCEPVSLGGFSIFNPTQELVDAYEMENGEAPITGYTVVDESNNLVTPIINPASGYVDAGFKTSAHPKGWHPARVHNMYVDREARFYASINFSMQRWKTTTIQLWKTGKDGRDHAGSDYCKTGYIQKKLADPNMSITPAVRNKRARIFFRLGEIYLNYAEALNESVGPVGDVYHYVNEIRNRVGLPDLPAGLSKEEMRERIRHERRIELAFEHHRFFDVRRWKIAEQTDNEWIHGMNIYAGTIWNDESFYARVGVEKRVFESPKHYLFPVPQGEIDKSRAHISQNPGWLDVSDSEDDE